MPLSPKDNDLKTLRADIESRPQSVDVSDIVALLESMNEENRSTITKLLETIVRQDPSQAKKAVRCLTPLLNHDDDDLRSEAAVAISYIATESPQSLDPAIDSLVNNIDEDNPVIRLTVTAALSEAASTYPTAVASAVPKLTHLLDSEIPLMRNYATSTFLNLATEIPEVVVPVSSVLVDVIEMQFESSIDLSPGESEKQLDTVPFGFSLFEVDAHEGQVSISRNAAAILAIVAENNPSALTDEAPRLIDIIDRPTDSEVLFYLLTVLGFVAEQYPSVILPAAELLGARLNKTDDPTTIGKIAWVFSLLADDAPETVSKHVSPSISSIIDVLGADPHVQIPVVSLLAYVAEQYPNQVQPARPVLHDLLDSDYPQARTGAILTLGFVGDETTISKLRTIKNIDQNENVQRAAKKSIQLIQRQ